MEWLQSSIDGALMVMTVLGIPVGLLFIIGYRTYRASRRSPFFVSVRRWDGVKGGSRQASKKGPQLHCWDVMRCAPNVRKNCPAPQYPDLPCWQAMKKVLGGRVKDECPHCQLFLSDREAA